MGSSPQAPDPSPPPPACCSQRDAEPGSKAASPSLDFLDLGHSDNMQRFLTNPCPKKAGVVQCHIRRRKSGTSASCRAARPPPRLTTARVAVVGLLVSPSAGAGKLYPEYYLFLKQGDRFLLAGRKRPNNKVHHIAR